MNTTSASSFNLNSFVNGKSAINRLGQKVKFVIMTRGKMLVSVQPKYALAETMKMNLDGTRYKGVESGYDLVEMVEEVA